MNVLKSGNVFDFDEITPGHPGCTSHFECIGNFDRVLCHAMDGVKAAGIHGGMPVGGGLRQAGGVFALLAAGQRETPDDKKGATGIATQSSSKHGGSKSAISASSSKEFGLDAREGFL